MYYNDIDEEHGFTKLLHKIPDADIFDYIEEYANLMLVEDLMPYHIEDDRIKIYIRLGKYNILDISQYNKASNYLYLGILSALKTAAEHNKNEHQKQMEADDYEEYLKLKEKFEDK